MIKAPNRKILRYDLWTTLEYMSQKKEKKMILVFIICLKENIEKIKSIWYKSDCACIYIREFS